eukprot:CAMPEP_0182556794 /NCGR_PEP_ID=MMETSP1324-20130603/946_1 /TAXON_ID=236786 /ORGANISM="Florenciella sp., Strain RCC1587" /LENGTH=35 /DNA_ID= /DNA_START= /DNA_END= /DNA_ORIENTATION=
MSTSTLAPAFGGHRRRRVDTQHWHRRSADTVDAAW